MEIGARPALTLRFDRPSPVILRQVGSRNDSGCFFLNRVANMIRQFKIGLHDLSNRTFQRRKNRDFSAAHKRHVRDNAICRPVRRGRTRRTRWLQLSQVLRLPCPPKHVTHDFFRTIFSIVDRNLCGGPHPNRSGNRLMRDFPDSVPKIRKLVAQCKSSRCRNGNALRQSTEASWRNGGKKILAQ
jgi:hypothetical protein